MTKAPSDSPAGGGIKRQSKKMNEIINIHNPKSPCGGFRGL